MIDFSESIDARFRAAEYPIEGELRSPEWRDGYARGLAAGKSIAKLLLGTRQTERSGDD